MINELGLEYAKALIDLSQDADDDLNSLAILNHILNDEQIKKTIFHPLIDKDAKKELFTNVFQNKVSKVFMEYIYVLVDNERLNIVGDIYDSYQYLYDYSKGILHCEIITNQELKDNQLKQIIDYLKKQYQKNDIQYQQTIDQNLIGGIKIKVGNDIIDASIDDQLLQLKESIR